MHSIINIKWKLSEIGKKKELASIVTFIVANYGVLTTIWCNGEENAGKLSFRGSQGTKLHCSSVTASAKP